MSDLYGNTTCATTNQFTTADFSIEKMHAAMEEGKRLMSKRPVLYCHPDNREWLEREVAKVAGDVPLNLMCRIETSELMNVLDKDGNRVAYKIDPAMLEPVLAIDPVYCGGQR